MNTEEQQKTQETQATVPHFTVGWIIPVLAKAIGRMAETEEEEESFDEFSKTEKGKLIIQQTSLCFIEMTKESQGLITDLMLTASTNGPMVKPFIVENSLFFSYEIGMKLMGQDMDSDDLQKRLTPEIREQLEAHDQEMKRQPIYVETMANGLFLVKLHINTPLIGFLLSLDPFFWSSTSSGTFTQNQGTLYGYTDSMGLSIIHSSAKAIISSKSGFTEEMKESSQIISDALDQKMLPTDSEAGDTDGSKE